MNNFFNGRNVQASNVRWKVEKYPFIRGYFPPFGFHFPHDIFTLAKPHKPESGKGGKVEVAFHLERMK